MDRGCACSAMLAYSLIEFICRSGSAWPFHNLNSFMIYTVIAGGNHEVIAGQSHVRELLHCVGIEAFLTQLIVELENQCGC